jgi:hypothetical protein
MPTKKKAKPRPAKSTCSKAGSTLKRKKTSAAGKTLQKCR